MTPQAEDGAAPPEDAVRVLERLALARRHRGKRAQTSMATLGVSCRTNQGYLIVTLCGALDAVAAPALREHLLRLVQEGPGRLVIDLSSVTDADANGLSVLVGTGRRVHMLGGSMRLATPPAALDSLLRTTGLDRQLHVYHSVATAISGEGSR